MEPANVKYRDLLRGAERVFCFIVAFIFWNALYYIQRVYVWARYHKFSLSYWKDNNFGGY